MWLRVMPFAQPPAATTAQPKGVYRSYYAAKVPTKGASAEETVWVASNTSWHCATSCERAQPPSPPEAEGESCMTPAWAGAYDLLVLVPSTRSGSHQVTIDAWAQWSAPKCTVRVLFVAGGAQHTEIDPHNKHILLVAAPEINDSYRHATLKNLLAFQWAVQALRFRYVLKVDHDSHVCLGKLLRFLRYQPRTQLGVGQDSARRRRAED